MASERSAAAGTPPAAGTGGGGFAWALEGLQATGASVAMRDLVEQLARHGEEEGELLESYDRLARSSTDGATRYLVDLIMEDERRHHRLLVDVATSMAWDTVGGVDGAVPPLGRPDEALLDATRRLREYEEADHKELARLRKQLRPFEDTTPWGLVVDLILLDTEKHTAILRFLERHERRG